MKVLFIVRSTFYSVRGGDTVQVMETARELINLGVETDIRKTNEKIDYSPYDLLHFFNIIRPGDILSHIKKSEKRFVVSAILVDYSVFDKYHRSGVIGRLFRVMPKDSIEYIKTLGRAIMNKDPLTNISYIWKGQKRSIKEILERTDCVFVQAKEEYKQLVTLYKRTPPYAIVHNGVDTKLFKGSNLIKKEQDLVICAARIEGIKNQYNLIKALNNTSFRLFIIGDWAPNQKEYYTKCKKMACDNIIFIRHLPQNELLNYYAKAKIHVLPSFFEICGLSSLEAAVMGCQVVITSNGYTEEYFRNSAFYCDPSDPSSILNAIEKAAKADNDDSLKMRIISQFTWQLAAQRIFSVYQKYIA